MLRQMDRIVQAILDVTVQGRHKPVPQAALGENQEADAVDLVHGPHDAGEEGFGDAMAVVSPPGQEQVFQLIEGGHHGNLQAAEHLHQHLEKGQDQVLPAGPDLEVQFRETEGDKVSQRRFVAFEDGSSEALMDVPAHEAGGVVRLCSLDVPTHQLPGPVRIEPCFRANPAKGAWRFAAGGLRLGALQTVN